MRVYLTGRIAVQGPHGTVDESDLPGRQGRLLLCYLVLLGRHPVPHERIAELLWGAEPPESWQVSLKSIVSRTRSTLQQVGVPPEHTISRLGGAYQFRPPDDVWVDVEAGARAIERAEAALRRRDLAQTWAEATVTTAIARRPFLPQEDDLWIDEVREQLRVTRLRALDCLVEVWLARAHFGLALSLASESVGLAPFRESSYRLQMRAHAAAGDRAEALRTYERCARLLEHELGVAPTVETRELYDALRAGRSIA